MLNSYQEHKVNQRKVNVKVKQYITDVKITYGCVECGLEAYDENDAKKLQFHHRDPRTKLFDVSHFWNFGDLNKTFVVIIQEISKCDVLCDKCHKDKHKGKIF
jgi:hypothetical protein